MSSQTGSGQTSFRAFAKLNLGLHVLDQRVDGYHNVWSVMQAIDICDDVSVSLIEGQGPSVRLDCDREDLANEHNLAWIAADRLLTGVGADAAVHVRLVKRIPPGAGLGGGSSDAAAVLRALDGLLPAAPPGVLLEIAASIGSDVPYFLTGGTALAEGRGTEITALADLPARSVAVVLPAVEVSTAGAYRALAERRAGGLTHSGEPYTIDVYGSLRSVRGAGAVRDRLERMVNDFEDVVFQQHPALADVKVALLASGARQAALTGSGSAVFGLFDSTEEASRAAGRLEAVGLRVAVTRFLTRAECGISL